MDDNQIIIDIGFDTFITQLKTLQKQYELNTAALKEMEKAGEGNSEAYVRLQQETKVLRSEISGVEKTIQNEIKAQKANEGSLVQLRAQLANLNKQYDSMDGLARMSKAGEDLQQKIKALNDQILGLEGDTGRMQRNVGNYPAAIKPVTAQLREMQQQLVQLRMEGKANTAEYQELAQKTGELKDAMMDAQQEVKNMASDTGNLDSVLQAAQLAAGGFSAVMGVMNLVGDENSETAKEIAEAQKKLQAAIAITTGLQAVQNALQSQSAFMLGLNKIRILAAGAAQKIYAAVTRDAAAAQGVFNRVAKSNIYIWLAGAILSVVGAITAFNKGSKEQEEQLEATNEELTSQLDILNNLTKTYGLLYKKNEGYINNQIERMKAQGASIDEIRAKEDELFKAEEQMLQQQERHYANDIANIDKQGEKIRKLSESLYYQRIEYQKELNAGNKDYADFLMRTITQNDTILKQEQEKYDAVLNIIQQREQYNAKVATTEAERAKEDEEERRKEAERYKKMLEKKRKASQDFYREIKMMTLEELGESDEKLANAISNAAERAGLFDEDFSEIDPDRFKGMFEIPDSTIEDGAAKMELWAETYADNADKIEQTSSALGSSFASVASMYQQMAQDESKSEEEREKAAKRAKAWAAIQIGTNAGTAIAKGVATAVDVGFPAAIPAMATMVAAIMSAIAQAKSLVAEAHETGGVIGGRFVGATSGADNVLMTGRRGELVLDADQQKRLFDIANGTLSPSLSAQLVSALQAMPAPVVDYQEFTRFTQRVTAFNENSKLK